MKKIDVIIPAYKAHKTLPRALASILSQSIIDEVEVIVANDADEHDYQDIIKTFEPYMSVREIKLEKNGGPGVARQFGINNSSSPYFTCMDADDTFATPFALQQLVKTLDDDPKRAMTSGQFFEEHPPLQFVPHQHDMIWMFGKIYRRSFIQKYGIRFNETRANEDNGFNTIIKLIANENEQIHFLEEPCYFWHFKEDSITRINNGEYSYNQSFPGYTENMIYAITFAKELQPFNSNIDVYGIQIMAILYTYYLQTKKRDPRFEKQNFEWCVIYYHAIFKALEARLKKDVIAQVFGQTLAQQYMTMPDIVADETIFQFIDRIKREKIAETPKD